MRKTWALLPLLLFLPLGARALDAASFASEAQDFLGVENLMHRDLAVVAAELRKTPPLMLKGQGPTASGDLCLGYALVPFYAYRSEFAGLGPFADLGESSPGVGSSLTGGALGAALAFPGGLVLGADLSALPAIFRDGDTRSYVKLGASALFRLLDERFYGLGALVGLGASYVGGSEDRELQTSFDDGATTSLLDAGLNSTWNYGLFDAELFLHKTFFLINFYTRADASLALGSTKSSLRGVTIDGAAPVGAPSSYTATLDRPVASLTLCAGMELILGELKLTAEGGREWRSGALFTSVGFRYGM